MSIILGWLAIGFISAVLIYSVESEAVLNARLLELAEKKNVDPSTLKIPEFTAYQVMAFIFNTCLGVVSVFNYYKVRAIRMRLDNVQ